jgi:ferric-dicitrate binding protein FerR (iron transport regulator)
MEKPEEIWFLLSRNLSGEATAQEKEALMEALRHQPALMQQYELIQRLWKPGSQTGNEEVESRVSSILRKSALEEEQQITRTPQNTAQPQRNTAAQQPQSLPRIRKLYRMIAVAAAILIAATSTWYITTQRQETGNEIIAKKGSKTRTILPDGSTVWLNAGSSLQYDPNFSGPIREVTLQGEAYFDIVKQPQKPFIVHAGNINIKVLGTAFNVKSYAEEKTIETTLIRGLVQITREGGNKEAPVYLHPNQKIILLRAPPAEAIAADKKEEANALHTKNPGIINLDSNLSEKERFETAWVYNRLEFRGETFEELAQKLERWYNITIHFEEAQVRKLEFNGSLENETVEQAFAALAAAVPFSFRVQEHDIYITTIKTNQ